MKGHNYGEQKPYAIQSYERLGTKREQGKPVRKERKTWSRHREVHTNSAVWPAAKAVTATANSAPGTVLTYMTS